jgi:hypothetical protein
VVYCKFSDSGNDNGLIVTLPFRIFTTGDLAYYATAKGKQSSIYKWCWCCQLSHSQWQSSDQNHGLRWMQQSIKEKSAKVIDGNPVMGLKTKPLIEHVEVEARYECPVKLPHSIQVTSSS